MTEPADFSKEDKEDKEDTAKGGDAGGGTASASASGGNVSASATGNASAAGGIAFDGDVSGVFIDGSGQSFGEGNVVGDGFTSASSTTYVSSSNQPGQPGTSHVSFTSEGSSSSSSSSTSDAEEVREESWPVSGPVELELSIDIGRIDVHLDDENATEVRVEVRHDTGGSGAWARGLSGVINWIGNATGGVTVGGTGITDAAELGAEAVRATEISWSEAARRLVVRSPREIPLRIVPLIVTVTAPAGSRVAARTGSADVTVTGRAGRAAAKSGSGRVSVAAVDGDAELETGSGEIDLGSVGGRARMRTGSGGIRAGSLGGAGDVKSGSGDISLGAVAGNLDARTGSGDLEISDAKAGSFDITTGSGNLRVAVHPGVAAELDLSSGSGRARSDLEVGSAAPQNGPALRIVGRTGSGDVLVTRATVGV